MLNLSAILSPIPIDAQGVSSDFIETLQQRWQTLEEKVKPAFFLGWSWIHTWVERLDQPAFLVSIQDDSGADIALGIFCHYKEVRHKVFGFHQLRLHTTGCREKDFTTIEYNNMLCIPEYIDLAWEALLEKLQCRPDLKWCELVIEGAEGILEEKLSKHNFNIHRRAGCGSAFVDLDKLRDKNISDANEYIASLGKNARAQLRRSIKLYAEKGPLIVEKATGDAQIKTFFAEMVEHHNAKWNAIGRPSVMQIEACENFHKHLIARGTEKGELEIIRVRAGDYKFGWLYNFIYNDAVYFYLSGFQPEKDNRLKPGLVTHALAVEKYINQDMKIYDFMGGDNRYKLSLGQEGPDIVSFALQKSHPLIIAENIARRIKNLKKIL